MLFKCVIVLAMLAIGVSAHADDSNVRIAREIYDFSFNFSLGSVGLGGVFPVGSGANSLETGVTLLSFGVEHNRTGLGLSFSPLNVLHWSHWDDSDEGHLSLANLHLYWNVLSRELFLGPFVSASYLFVGQDRAYWNRYVLTAGLQGGIRMETERWNLPLLLVETGFRLIDGRGNFFVGTKIDLLPILLFRLGLWFASADDV